ncbi:hypothetical protein RCS94_08815 [Orbaceae bacterium ac157xtp]
MIAPNSYGVLTATSANVIQGRAPAFTGQSGASKLGFKIGNTLYSESRGNIVGGTEKIFDRDLKLSEFVVQTLSLSDFTVANDYYDADGDEEHPTTPFTIGNVSYEWRDGNGNKITDHTKMIGCGSGLSLPLTLKIRLPAQAHSKYGYPKDGDPAPLEQNYKITTTSGICFAKPNSMIVNPSKTWVNVRSGATVWNSGDPTPDPVVGGGYDQTQFDPKNGFKASTTPKFPTTGFAMAKFQLVMTGAQTDYTYSVLVSPTNAVTVDTNGNVTLNRKPNSAVTVKATLRSNTNIVHEYTFDPRTVWMVPYLKDDDEPVYKSADTYAVARSRCGSRLPTRAQLTNSPQKTAPKDWTFFINAHTRKIDGSIYGEWGIVDDRNYRTYPGSKWTAYYGYWTKDNRSSTSQFRVEGDYGAVVYHGLDVNSHSQIVCLG